MTYIFGYPVEVLSSASFELHLQHLLAGTLPEAIVVVILNTVPHVLALLVAVSPARFEDAAFLVGTVAFDLWGSLFAEAIFVFARGVFLGSSSRCTWPLRMALFDPTTGLESRFSTGGSC